MSQTHIIQRQELHVELHGTEQQGLDLKNRLSALCTDRLQQTLEQVLDRYSPSDGHLYIAYLEIDAGTVTLDALEQELTDAVKRAVGEALREVPAAYLEPYVPEDQDVENMRYSSDRQRLIDVFIYFLRTGRLPWSFCLPQNTSLEQVLLTQLQGGRENDLLLKERGEELRHLITSSYRVRQRLVWQFSEPFRLALIAILSPSLHRTIESLLSTWRQQDVHDTIARPFNHGVWLSAFSRLGANERVETLVPLAFHSLPSTLPESARTELRNAITALWKPMDLDRADPGDSTTESDTTSRTGDLPEGAYIDNAGIILLHPFLPQFFAALGVAEDHHILQPDRALALLHYLTTGSTTVPEYELVVPKILCGMALDEPVSGDVELTGNERDEATALLEAVVRHWKALRSTSPDGLRESFLMRPGKLSLNNDDEWVVQIERRTYDILLDQLPWGISMIRLPWMERICRVEWGG